MTPTMRRRFPWEQDQDEQGPPIPELMAQGPPPPPDWEVPPRPPMRRDGPPPVPQDAGPPAPQFGAPPLPPMSMQDGPPPYLPAPPSAPPPMPQSREQGPPQPATDRFQRQAQQFQDRKNPGLARQIAGGILSVSPRLRGVGAMVSGEAGRERELENLKVSKGAADEEQQGIQRQIALQNAKRQDEVGQSTIRRNDALANRPAPRVPPTPEESTATRTRLADQQGLVGEDRQRFILTGQMAPPRAAPPPKPTLTEVNTERETEANRLGLKGDARTAYIANGRTPNPARPPAPTSPGSSTSQADAKTIAQGIFEGKQPPTMAGLYRNGGPVRAELQRMGYDLVGAQRDWQAVQKHLATLNGQQQERLRQAITFTHDSLDNIEDLYSKWKKLGGASGVRVLNKATLAASKQLPGEMGAVATNLESQIADLTSELGTVYKGGNASTDESLRLAAQNLQADWNENTFRSAVGQIRKNLTIRKNSIFSSMPVGVSASSPYNPRQEGGGGTPAMVNLQAPDGSIKPVPADQVEHFLKLGAKRVP